MGAVFTKFFKQKNNNAKPIHPDHIELTEVTSNSAPNPVPHYELKDIARFVERDPETLPLQQKIIRIISSLTLVAGSAVSFYWMIYSVTHQSSNPQETDEYGLDQKQMRFSILYGLLAGAAFQWAFNLMPIHSVVRRELNRTKALFIPLECATLFLWNGLAYPPSRDGNYICSQEFRKKAVPWGSFEYGIVLTHLATKLGSVIYKKYQQRIFRENKKIDVGEGKSTSSQLIDSQKIYVRDLSKYYKSVPWLIVSAFSVANITISYCLNLEEKMHPVAGYYFDLIISGLGYGGAGFLIGDFIENIKPTSSLNWPHAISFYIYGVFVNPGQYYYNDILMVLGGLTSGWSMAYSRRQTMYNQLLMEEQIKKLEFLLSPEFSDCANKLKTISEDILKKELLSKKKRDYLKWAIFGTFIISVPLIAVFGRDILVAMSAGSGIYLSIGVYYLSPYIIKSPYIPKKLSFAALSLNNNIMLASQAASFFIKLMIKSILFGVSRDHTYNKGYYFAIPAGLSVAVLVATSFVSFFDRVKTQYMVDQDRFICFVNFMQNLAQDNNNRLESPALTEKEVLFIYSNFRDKWLLTNNLTNVSPVSDSTTCLPVISQNKSSFFIRIIRDDDERKNFQESAVQAGLLLPFIVYEFSFETHYEKYFRF